MKKKSFSAYYKLAIQKNEKRIGNQVLTPNHHISALKQEKKKMQNWVFQLQVFISERFRATDEGQKC